jgi:hypothetical protein
MRALSLRFFKSLHLLSLYTLATLLGPFPPPFFEGGKGPRWGDTGNENELCSPCNPDFHRFHRSKGNLIPCAPRRKLRGTLHFVLVMFLFHRFPLIPLHSQQ